MGHAVLSQLLVRFLARDTLRSRVEHSISEVTGLRKGEWLLTDHPFDADKIAATTEQMLAWCHDRIAKTRRPYCIDQMAIAIACAEPGSTPIASSSFRVFCPVEFYEESGVTERVTQFMQELPVDELDKRTAIRFAAALFSWGDVAKDAIFRNEHE